MGGPGLPRFRLDLRKPHARRWIGDADEVLAGRALNLPPGELSFALQGLVAVGAVEFECVGIHGLHPHKRRTRLESMFGSNNRYFQVVGDDLVNVFLHHNSAACHPVGYQAERNLNLPTYFLQPNCALSGR